jgi:hypothetical protein
MASLREIDLAASVPSVVSFLLLNNRSGSNLSDSSLHGATDNTLMFTVNDDSQRVFDSTGLTLHNVLLAAFLVFLALATILGNIFVLLAIFVDFHLRSPTHYLMGSLAMADLLLGILVLPFSSVQLYFDTWPFGSWYCEVWLGMNLHFYIS